MGCVPQRRAPLPSISMFARAHELHATRTCYEELVFNAGEYPAEHLAYLLAHPAPLEAIRELWLKQENEELEQILSWVLHGVRTQGLEQNHGPNMEL